MNTEARELFTLLGIERPVYWHILEAPGFKKGAWESTDEPDVQKEMKNGAGLFFTPNEMGETRNKKGNLRHEENVIRFTSIFVDMDEGTPAEQVVRLSRLPLEPSALVRTSRGFHVYWLLDRFEEIEAGEWRLIQETLAEFLGGDPACVDPARLMRVPGSYHVKGEPTEVILMGLNKNAIYSMADIRSQLEGLLGDKLIHSPPLPKNGPKTTILARKRKIRVRPLGVGERHAALVEEGARLFNGAAPSEIPELTSILKAWYAQSCQPLKDDWEEEVDGFVKEWLLKKEFGSFNPTQATTLEFESDQFQNKGTL